MEPTMHHTDEDDAFASSTMAAEGSQPEATLAATTSQPELSSDEAARAQCLRCKTNGSQSGKHTCGKRRSTSPAATAAKRPRPKRNSTDPPEEHVVVDHIWSPASTNVNERLSVAEARMADFSPMAMPNMPAQDSECEAPSAMEHEQLELGSYKIGEGLAQPSSVSDSEPMPVGSPMVLACAAAAFGSCPLEENPLGEALAQPSSVSDSEQMPGGSPMLLACAASASGSCPIVAAAAAAVTSGAANASSTAGLHLFRRLLSRRRLEQLELGDGRRVATYEYTLELEGGALIVCDAATLQLLQLKAASGEPEWRCGSCNASGWSQLRACICMDCGADSPVDAELMTELKHAMRQEMLAAPRGRKYLGGRKAVLGPRQLQSDPRAEGAYDVFGDDSDFGEDVDSAVEAEVQAQPQLRTIWDTHRWEGLYFLDAGVAMLTLGQQAIVRDELRGKLQPAAIATLYILLPRLLEGEAGSCTGRSVIPPVNAIWQALSEMPGKHAASFADALNCAWRRRQSRLERVLVESGVPAAWRDARNLVCGLRGVTVTRVEDGGCRWTAGKSSFSSLAGVLKAMEGGADWLPRASSADNAGFDPDSADDAAASEHHLVCSSEELAQLLLRPTNELPVGAYDEAKVERSTGGKRSTRTSKRDMVIDSKTQLSTEQLQQQIDDASQLVHGFAKEAAAETPTWQECCEALYGPPPGLPAKLASLSIFQLTSLEALRGGQSNRATPPEEAGLRTPSDEPLAPAASGQPPMAAETDSWHARQGLCTWPECKGCEEIDIEFDIEAEGCEPCSSEKKSDESFGFTAEFFENSERVRRERARRGAAQYAQADCGTCKYCLDMPKFGGPGTRKMACVLRQQPSASCVTEYFSYFREGAAELEVMHATLSDAVLDVWVQWHLPGGRLASQCPPGAGLAELRGAKNAQFRVPFDALTHVACFAVQHAKLMQSGCDGSLTVKIPSSAVSKATGTIAASYLRKTMTSLREWPPSTTFAVDKQVETAYQQALRELGQAPRRVAQPLLDDLRDEILRECDLTKPRDMTLATWVVNAPLLMQRTVESVSTLHADLSIAPREARGFWNVPGYTKTTDGVEGCVDRWRHRDGCVLASRLLHEALERPLLELLASACSPGADGKLCFRNACPVCLTWLSRRLQGLSASPRDGVSPLYQEWDEGAGRFTGRMAHPDKILFDLREKMALADERRIKLGQQPFAKEGRTLYMARHGGIMQMLKDGFTIEFVAERARIPVSTLVRYYRRHNVIDDVFESNGQFGKVEMSVVISQARTEGWLVHDADVQHVLKLLNLTLDDAAQLPRAELYNRVAHLIAADAGLASAVAALLRNANVHADLGEGDGVLEFTEEDELAPSALHALLRDACEQELGERFAILDEMEAAEQSRQDAAPALTAAPSLEAPSLGAPSLEPISTALTLPAEISSAMEPETPLFSSHLGERWHHLAAIDPKLRGIFEGAKAKGMQVVAPPAPEALQVGTDEARLLPRTILYRWKEHGWLLGEVRACNSNPSALHNGMPVNFIVWYEHDDREGVHALQLSDYASPELNGWLLFRPAIVAEPKPLPCRMLPSSASSMIRRQPSAGTATSSASRTIVMARPAAFGPPALSFATCLPVVAQPMTVANANITRAIVVAHAPSLGAVAPSAAAAARSKLARKSRRALFARASLHGQPLRPVPLLLCAPSDIHVAVSERLDEQAALTGQGHDALCEKLSRVRSMHMYLQAASAGHAGLHGSAVGGQLWTLSAKPSFLAMLFLDCARIHASEGARAHLAFPRGGFQGQIRTAIQRSEAEALVAALQVSGPDDASELQDRSDDDPLIIAGEAVLNKVFARLVRAMHGPGGVFAKGLPPEVLERGLAELNVGSVLVKELGRHFGCANGRFRLLKAGAPSDLVGWKRSDGRSAVDALSRVRPYSCDTVKAYRAALSWWLRGQGWQVVTVPRQGDIPPYVSVVQLETRIFKKAYRGTLQFCYKQKLFRAMAATEDVMQQLFVQLRLTAARDLQMANMMELSYALGLRVSDAEQLKRDSIRFGRAGLRADGEVVTERHKGDGQGEGFSRWLQHCAGCEFEWRSAPGNADGRRWSKESASGGLWSAHRSPASRCRVCLLLWLLEMQGDAPADAPLFRKLAPEAKWSWHGAPHGQSAHFTMEPLGYERFNEDLHQLLKVVNEYREGKGLPPWTRAGFHWHMFRHGHVIMALIFGTPPSEIERSLRMTPTTLLQYRAHVVGGLAAAFEASQQHAGVQARADAVACNELAVAVAGSADAAELQRELTHFLGLVKMSPKALRHAAPGLRQLIVYGSVTKRYLSQKWAQPLLDELGKADMPAAAPHAVALQTLVTEVAGTRALAEGGENGGAESSHEAEPIGGGALDAEEDSATLVNASVDADDATLATGQDVANLDELHDMWQDLYAEAASGAWDAWDESERR